MATVLFMLPMRFWAFTVVVLFLGTIALTYTLCIHENVCPKLPQLPTISGTWVTPPGNYISRTTVSIGCTMFFFGNIIMYWINHSRRSPSAKGPSNEALLYMAQIGVFCLSWVGAICDSSTPTCNGNGRIHSLCAVTFFILYDAYLYFILHMKTRSPADTPSRWMFVALYWSLLTKLRFLPVVQHLLGSLGHDQTPLAIFEWTDVACINLLVIRFMWPYTAYGVGVVLSDSDSDSGSGSNSSSNNDSRKTPAPLPLTAAELKKAEAEGRAVPRAAATSREPLLAASQGSVRVLTAWTADQWVVVVGAVAAFTLLGTWAVAIRNGTVAPHTLPDISKTWIKAPGDWIARWGAMVTASYLTIMHVMVYQMRSSTLWGALGARAAVSHGSPSPFLLLLLATSIAASFCLGLMGVVDEAENATLHRHAATGFYCLFSFYMLGYLVDSIATGRSSCGRVLVLLLACAGSLVTKVRFAFVAARLHRSLCSPTSTSSMCLALAPGGDYSTPGSSDAIILEWLDVVTIAVFTVALVYDRPAAEGRRILWAIFEKVDTWDY